MNYEPIDLSHYFQTGEGGTALTYNHNDGRSLIKLFKPGYGAETAEREFKVNRLVFDLGIPTPEPIRLVTDGERFGAEYELIQGKRSFTRIISQEPNQLEPMSRRFARMAKQLHATKADTSRLPDMRDMVQYWIDNNKFLPPDFRMQLTEALEAIPAASTCLHGDLHIGNIITDGARFLWIDVGDFAYGCPQWDLGMMYYASNNLSPERADEIFHLDQETLRKHWAIFAREYWGTEDENEIRARERELHPYVALKLFFVISKINNGESPMADRSIALIRRLLDKA